MSQDRANHTPTRIIRIDDYQREHAADAPKAPPKVRATTEEEQSGYRSFSPDYYAGIRAGMLRAGVNPDAAAAEGGQSHQPAMIGAVPQDELLDHNYDGIQEYDNPTPGWWHAVFIATVLFGGFYTLVYHLAVPPLAQRHATAEARHLNMQFAELNKLETGEPKILAIMSEEAWLARGEAIFSGACTQCHASDASGLIGPNLTDEKYKNIETLMDIPAFVADGSPTGTMPPQSTLLSENEIALVSAYVASLRGKNLPTGSTVSPEYEGHPIAPWPGNAGATPATDETPEGDATGDEQANAGTREQADAVNG